VSARKQSERDLEIEQDPAFQRREWAAQRIGWALMAAVISAALAGVFGDGPIARARAVSSDGNLRVEYERIARGDALTALHISVHGSVLRSGTAHVWLDRKYAERMFIQTISPEPDSVSTHPTRLRFAFGAGPGADSAGIHIQLKPTAFGFYTGAIGVDKGAAVVFKQFVLP
jgi:hypothetical protein